MICNFSVVFVFIPSLIVVEKFKKYSGENMPKINELIEWDYLGTRYSVYIKHFVDDDGRKGMNMIFEDVTRGKVTEMVIPSRKYPAFVRAITDGAQIFRGL